VEGGAEAVIRAFLDLGCTLLVPAFTDEECAVPPPPGRQVLQNGWDDSWHFDPHKVVVYERDSAMISREMGAIPARLLQMEGRARGDHPLDSFCALGPLAAELIQAQTPLNVYAPFDALYARPASRLVLIGVGLTRATAIHLAEQRAGRRLFRRWGLDASGVTVETACGSCSEGFENLAHAVRAIETRRLVGKSEWRIYPFKAFVDAAAMAIAQDPQITHCADPNCIRCNDSIKGGPLL